MTWATKCPLFDASISGGQYIKSNTANNKLVGTDSASYDIPLAYLSTDGTLSDNSDVKVPTQKAVKTYADGLALTLGTGNVVGPGSSTDGDLALFSGATGKILKESSKSISTDGTFAGNSDSLIPTQKAVKTYADTKMPSSYLDTDGTLAANSNSKVPSQRAVKTYVDDSMVDSNLVQVVNYKTGAVAATAVTIPLDDTIPQKTEGAEFMTLAITPVSASNVLIIVVNVMITSDAADNITVALFQDALSSAIAVASDGSVADSPRSITLVHRMVAGTISETTFKVRMGGAAHTLYMNGKYYDLAPPYYQRVYGGAAVSSITIMEVAP